MTEAAKESARRHITRASHFATEAGDKLDFEDDTATNEVLASLARARFHIDSAKALVISEG